VSEDVAWHMCGQDLMLSMSLMHMLILAVSEFHDHNLTDSDESQSEDDESRDNFNRGSSGNRVRASNATITPETFLTHMTFGHRLAYCLVHFFVKSALCMMPRAHSFPRIAEF